MDTRPPVRSERRARSDALSRSPRGASRGWQIGPRIRIGGTVGKVGQNVKIAAGKALTNPIVDGALTLIPGVGPAFAAAAGAAGQALDTSNGGLHGASGVGKLATGAAKGYAAGKIAGGIKDAVNMVRTGGLDALRNAASAEAGRAGNRLASGQSPIAGGQGMSAWEKLLLGATAAAPLLGGVGDSSAAAARDELLKKQVGAGDEAASMARQLFAGATPIRQAAEAGLQARLAAGPRPVPDVSGLRSKRNPFASQYTVPAPRKASPMASFAASY